MCFGKFHCPFVTAPHKFCPRDITGCCTPSDLSLLALHPITKAKNLVNSSGIGGFLSQSSGVGGNDKDCFTRYAFSMTFFRVRARSLYLFLEASLQAQVTASDTLSEEF